MKKKALLASAIALATASAMTFAPVSYKVIDKASAAPVVADENVVKAAATLKAIYANVNANPALKTSFEEMIKVASENIKNVDISADLPNLADKVDDPAAANKAVQALLERLVVDFGKLNADFSDVGPELEAAIGEVNEQLGVNITRADFAAFLKEVKDGILEKIESDDFWVDIVEDGALTETAKKEIKAILNDQWDNSTNSVITSLKELYGNKAALLEDIDTLVSNLKSKLSEEQQRTLAVGAFALGVGYAQFYFDNYPLIEANGNTGKKYYFSIDYNTNLSKLVGFVKWTSTSNGNSIGKISTEEINGLGEERVVLDLNSVYGNNREVAISAVLNKEVKGVPQELDGVPLFSVKNRYNLGNIDGSGIISTDLTLVSDYQAKADALAGKVADFLKANPDLYNNTLKLNLTQLFEETLRQALLVQAAGAVTVNNGVSTLNVTPAQMGNVYNNQLDYVLNASKKALEDNKLTLKPAPALIYNIGVTANGEFNLSKDLIDSLTSKGIAVTGLKSGDAVVEVVLDQLKGASKLVIKKAESKVTGAKSDTYTLAVTDADGKEVVGFEKAHRVTLPVNGSSNVTVAKVEGDKLTYVGGQYDAATRTITFYTNELGDFVVVENSASFNDIANLNWAKDKIQLLADKGLLLGKGNGKFDPNGNVTRAEFTTMLVRAFNLNASTELTFNDVSENAWYHDAISAAKAYGIVNGRSASVFDPNAKITREEMASMAANALKAVLEFENPSNAEELLSKFVDGDKVVAVHRTNVAMLKNEAIIQGKGKNNYDPKGTATRAEAAVVLASLVDLR